MTSQVFPPKIWVGNLAMDITLQQKKTSFLTNAPSFQLHFIKEKKFNFDDL